MPFFITAATPVFAEAGRDLVAERAQALGELRRRLHLVEGELGVLVEIEVELLELGIERVERR